MPKPKQYSTRWGKSNIKYLKKTKASPATNLLEVTNVLQPVVSKCLRGWPDHHSSCKGREIHIHISVRYLWWIHELNKAQGHKPNCEKVKLTSEYMLKSPLKPMKIFGSQVLSWGLLVHVLKEYERARLMWGYIKWVAHLSNLQNHQSFTLGGSK